jgi:hypothetical protein
MAETAVLDTLESVIALCEKRYNDRPSAATDNSKNTYLISYKKFLTWYFNNRNNTAMALDTEDSMNGKVFATQKNTNMFYLYYVPENISGMKANAKRYFYAISWFRSYLEYPEGTALVESSIIRTALDKQQEYHNAHSAVTYGGIDPHKGLRDIMPVDEHRKLITYMWKSRSDYADVLFCFTWACNAGIRGCSARVFKLSNLNISFGYGPETSPPRNRTLMLILRKGPEHKEKSTSDRQVGVQRHRDYRQCSVFATGVLLLKLLRRLGNSIDFLQPDKKVDPNWWGIGLSNFNTLNDQSDPMRDVFAKTGVNPNCKITHHRTQAILHGGSNGLDPWKVSTFTKHHKDKLEMSYMPECEKSALSVMSGFSMVSSVQ